MATTQTSPKTDEIKLEYGVPQVVAFKFLQGKSYTGNYGTRFLYTMSDDRRMWVDHEDGADIERQLRELGAQRGEFVRLTKVRYPRGGGHAIRVERVAESYEAPAASGNDDTAAQLEKSIAIARSHGAQAFQRNAHVLPAAAAASPDSQAAAAAVRDNSPHDNPVAARLMSCYMSALDAVHEAQQYATRKGMGITFTSDDIRASAITLYIQHEKAMMEVRR